ncbi:MAG: endonuclease/exonuclease/phosphatase family protein [Archangiaceae bacterium]|nr:endonuclease/exonuclease/phosphatase family protein [Archangiaceae bacterium]
MKLKVASYNVHGFVGNDGQRDVARVADVLRSLQADVVALQEVAFHPDRDEPAELLSAVAGYRAFSAPVVRGDGYRHGNVVLTRLPILKSRRICLDFEQREPRTAIDMTLGTGARPLRVVATHLGLKPGERRFQVKLILHHVAEDEDSVTVLLGDFNEWFLVGRPLRWLHRRFGPSRSMRTWPASWPLFALDRVWVHPKAALARCSTLLSPLTRAASDHLPITAEVEV